MRKSSARAIQKYEAKQIARINKWRQRRPGRIARAVDFLTRPIVWAFRQIIPHSAVEATLEGNLWLAHRWAHEHSALRGLGAGSFAELAETELRHNDRFVRKTHRRAIYLASGVGFVAGFFGFLALPLGMAGALNLALRTIRRIGLCYGYAELDDTERLFIYYSLSLAGNPTQEEKAVSLQALTQLQRRMAEIEVLHQHALALAHHDFSKEITKQLVQVRLLTAIPVVGAAVGLIVDAIYIRSVGWAARNAYQRRWLRDRGRWPEGAEPPFQPARSHPVQLADAAGG
jgi:hypothetical protein